MQQLSNSDINTDSKHDIDNKYRAIGLDFNPFPLMPTPSRVKFVSGEDRKEKVSVIFEQINRVKKGDSISIGILGDYGLGKSHLLKHIEYILSRDPQTNPDENIVSYIHRPYDPRERCDFCYLCSLIIEYLNSSRKEDFLTSLIQKLYCKVAIKRIEEADCREFVKIKLKDIFLLFSKKRTEKYQKAIITRLENDFINIYDMEEEMDFYRLKTVVIYELCEQFETEDANRPDYIDPFFLEKMVGVFFEDERDEAKKSIIDQFTKNNKEARKFLKTVINIANYVDYKIFAILLDEIDQIPENELKMLLGELTVFIEKSGDGGPPPHILFILSYTPKPELLSPFYERRLGLKIGLERISKKDAEEMIKDYLNEARSFSGSVELKEPLRSLDPSLDPFDDEMVTDIWERSRGGQIGDILKSCFWKIEELVDNQLKQFGPLDEGSKEEALEPQMGQIPVEEDSIPTKPSKLDRERVLALYDSKNRNSDRSKLLEDAVRTLCKAQKNHTLNSVTIRDVADSRRRLDTKGGKKKTREVDIYLTRQKGKGPQEIVDIEIKAFNRKKESCVKLNDLEGSFELLERKIIDKLIILTVTDLDNEVLNKMKRFGGKAAICQINESQLAQLIYSTDKSFFGRDLKKEEAIGVAEDIGLIEYLNYV